MSLKLDLSRDLAAPPCALYAHTPPPGRSGAWHTLGSHLNGVAELAREFAEPFGGGSLAYLAGLTHDAGKATQDVQDALRARAEDGLDRLGTPHKVEGAALACLLYSSGNEPAALAMALVNYGHHSGIPDRSTIAEILMDMEDQPSGLDALIELLDSVTGVSVRDVAAQVRVPSWAVPNSMDLRALEMFARMCHSAVVDADFLDTQAHFDGKDEPRRAAVSGVDTIRHTFMTEYSNKYSVDANPDELGRLRRQIFDRSVEVGETHDGTGRVFRLPAPTGTGKTMSSAAFALSHAAAFDKRRVIVAVPFTSITTQNADAYREMFASLADEVVLEHHSDIVDDAVADSQWRRLSAANWDAEFIVTTTVQLFSSLLSNRPSATRRLHRIAESVVILDEVQALPLHLIPVILGVLKDLTENYGVTVLLASATQPAFFDLDVWRGVDFVDVLPLDDVPEVTRRVRFEVRPEPISHRDLAAEISTERQVLAIVNTTEAAKALHEDLLARSDGEVNVLHLSTRMCHGHRLDVLNGVRTLLGEGAPVRLISTQLIEAGVDVDFPVVYRALAPAEAIVQSAGRCNREGQLGTRGRVVVFEPADAHYPAGYYKAATEITRSLFGAPGAESGGSAVDFEDPRVLERYFQRLYRHVFENTKNSASDEIDELRKALNFPEVARLFQMIDDNAVPVVVPTAAGADDEWEVRRILEEFETPGFVPTRQQRRLLHRFTASASRLCLRQPGLIREIPHGPYEWIGIYDPDRGLVFEPEGLVL